MIQTEFWYSRLPEPLMAFVKQAYTSDPRRKYHNWDHIGRVYTWAKSLMPYDQALDLAILFHDVVYDEKPDKEVRSIDFMYDLFNDRNGEFYCHYSKDSIVRAAALIQTTIDHTPTDDNRLILCDLADLGNDFFRELNSQNIMMESVALYGIDNSQYYRNNIQFMRGLRNRLEDNMDNWQSCISEAQHFVNIIQGIGKQIRSSQEALCKL